MLRATGANDFLRFRTASYAPSVNGDEVRDTWFLRCGWHGGWAYAQHQLDTKLGRSPWGTGWGYAAREVDDLLRRIVVELDAGRPAGPLIKEATFRRKVTSRRYDIDAVDWFLDQLLRGPGHLDLAGFSVDPWRDAAVTQLTQVSDRARAGWSHFSEECWKAWRDFGQLPGVRMRWGRVRGGPVRPGRYELRTEEQHVLACHDGGRATTVRVGERSFTYRRHSVPVGSTANLASPAIAEIAARSWWDRSGHFADKTMNGRTQHKQTHAKVDELVDETGTPILYLHTGNANGRACACITFPDQRWLRFLVRGTRHWNAIMTAVDQAGNRVVRYKRSTESKAVRWTDPGGPIDIIVNPDWKLTEDLVLAIEGSAGLLERYFPLP
jgi:hypothetical protein